MQTQWRNHLVSLLVLLFLLFLAYGSTNNSSKSTSRSKSSAPESSRGSEGVPETGPPPGYDGAGVLVDGVPLYIYRMSTHHPEIYRACQNFTGKGYAFMVLAINATKATEKFTWHCWTNRIYITLNDGTQVKSIDLSDMKGFYRWRLNDEFSCTKTVYPGKTEFHYLAFYPSFSWKNVRKVKFQTGAFGFGIRTAQWMKIN